MTTQSKKARPNGETGHEAHCRLNAVRWAAVRGLGPKNRTREEFATEAEAAAYAAGFGDRRTMLYAITEQGLSAHIRNA